MTVEFSSDVKAELIKTNACDLDVARAAWVSTKGEDALSKAGGDRMEGLIKFLIREKHMSPLEHGSFTFFIHAPIFVAREFMRHRTFSFNEESGRYMKLKPEFYIPAESRPLVQQGKPGNYTFAPGTYDQYCSATENIKMSNRVAWSMYELSLEAGVAKEVARMCLPVNIYTSFYATANPRNLMQFLDLRTAPNALAEIRSVADQMEVIFKETMPITHNAWKESQWVAPSR